MPTFKLILRADKITSDNTAPVYLRITQNRRTSQKSTGVRIREAHWNPKRQEVRRAHPDHKILNEELVHLMSAARSAGFTAKRRTGRTTTASAVKAELEGRGAGCIFAYAEGYLSSRSNSEHFWDSRNVRATLKKVREFAGTKTLEFEDVDRGFLDRFDAWMSETRNNGINTRAKNLQILRRLFRRAHIDGHLTGDQDPFTRYSISLAPTSRERLRHEEIEKLAGLDLSRDPFLSVVRDVFLFSVYCQGMRFGDVCALRWQSVDQGRLHYTMMKNGRHMRVKLVKSAINILDRYEPLPATGSFVFPIVTGGGDFGDGAYLRKRISSANARVNKALKLLATRIDFPSALTFHMARHSFADLGRLNGHSTYDISKSLGHSKLQTTQTYLADFDQSGQDAIVVGIFGA